MPEKHSNTDKFAEVGLIVTLDSLAPIIASSLNIGNIAVTRFYIDGERGALKAAKIMSKLQTDPFILPEYEERRTNLDGFAKYLNAIAREAMPIVIRDNSTVGITAFWEDLSLRLSETEEFDGLDSIIYRNQ